MLVYQKADKSNHITIIHYIGDETVAVPCISSQKQYQEQSAPSHQNLSILFIYCAEECKIMKPGVLYKKEVSSDDPKPLTEMPKNLKQLQNL